jgi:cytoskeletal protein RodZ
MFSMALSEGAAEGGLGWLAWVVVAVFFVMVFLGWLASSRGWLKQPEEPAQEHHEEHAAH